MRVAITNAFVNLIFFFAYAINVLTLEILNDYLRSLSDFPNIT